MNNAGIEAEIGRLLLKRRLTLAVAESCTGGLVAVRITSVGGSSAWFRGGIVAYSNDVKIRQVGVSRALLARHGAVSGPVARQMAQGARRRLGADIGIGVTGIAGPTGGTGEKPVGLVFVGLAGANRCTVRRFRFGGGRAAVRRSSSQKALEMLKKSLSRKRSSL